MRVDDVRKKYIGFFKARGHAELPSASLVPENDPTTLFTGSGMQPLLPYLLGEPHPKGNRLVNSQRSFRAEDIEEVGDNRHTTFFEMLGNWSLGDYFKQEQLSWFFEFLTKEIGLDPHKLYVSVFAGDKKKGIPQDEESVAIWKQLFATVGIDSDVAQIGSEEEGYKRGIKGNERIFYYDATKNWWSRAGLPEKMPTGEPGGADSEVFYDVGTEHDKSLGEQCHPNCDCGRFLEIGNSVFMEYVKQKDGSFIPLPKKNVDFGAGLERIAAVSGDKSDVFLVDVFTPIITCIEERSKKSYADNTRPFRVIADHLRGVVFMMADGIRPSNTDQGYVLRRLLRRAVRYADTLTLEPHSLRFVAEAAIVGSESAYPTLRRQAGEIAEAVAGEEEKFRSTLVRGMREFEKLSRNNISGEDAFVLFSTYGFPIEMTVELAEERGIVVDRGGFQTKMAEHQAKSRAGAEQKFKGGLADHSEKSVNYHTTTHLLHQALRDVLGDTVLQKGSNITPERLRFDFAFDRKMTDEEKRRVEEIVNTQIKAALPVTHEDILKEEAEKRGAIGLFEEKYGDRVRVYRIGNYSLEYCGGPHVANTRELGTFRIVKEEAVASGIRRVKAVLE